MKKVFRRCARFSLISLMIKNAASIDDEFLFGPDILVAPILDYEARKRNVYLPAGTSWTDAWTDKKIKGGQWIEAEAPLERIPVYLRGDSRLR